MVVQVVPKYVAQVVRRPVGIVQKVLSLNRIGIVDVEVDRSMINLGRVGIDAEKWRIASVLKPRLLSPRTFASSSSGPTCACLNPRLDESYQR